MVNVQSAINFCHTVLHIREIQIALSEGTDIVVMKNVPMINFAKWTRCYDRIKDVFQHKSPDISKYRQTKASTVAYLEWKLRDVSIDSTTDQFLEERSIELEQREKSMKPMRRRADVLARIAM